MQPIQIPDWNSFSQHIDTLFPAQVNNLKKLTRGHIEARSNEKNAQYIKVACIDDYDGPEFLDTQGIKIVPPRAVLWEVHVPIHGLSAGWNNRVTDIGTLKRSLRMGLPPDLRALQTDLYFASMQLKEQKVYSEPETVRHYLISYCDKIYAKPLQQQPNTIWMSYKRYFNQAQMMILTNPTLYTELCSKLKELSSLPSPPEDKLYSYLVLLRSLPDTVARAKDGHIEAARSLKELLTLLDSLDEDGLPLASEITYNVINAVEWLTYLIPKMYGALPIDEKLVERLEKYISGENYKLAIRMEAAWALGWASVASIAVATHVHEYKKSTKSRVYNLHNNVLRQVVGTAYLRASFTLVSFGPARVSSTTVEPLPGTFYQADPASGPINISAYDSARQAASDIVYGELDQIVGGNIRFQLLLAVLAASWLLANNLIVVLFSLSATIGFWLSVAPVFVLLITVILLTWRWGRGYWSRIAIIWIAFVFLVASPWLNLLNWQQTLVSVSAFVTFLSTVVITLSPWASTFAVLPALVRFLGSILKRYL